MSVTMTINQKNDDVYDNLDGNDDNNSKSSEEDKCDPSRKKGSFLKLSPFFHPFHSGDHGKGTEDHFSPFPVKMCNIWSILALFGFSYFFHSFQSGDHGKCTVDHLLRFPVHFCTFWA